MNSLYWLDPAIDLCIKYDKFGTTHFDSKTSCRREHKKNLLQSSCFLIEWSQPILRIK